MGRKAYRSRRFSAFAAVCQGRRNRNNDRNFTCLSPWSILPCWFSLKKPKGEKIIDFRNSEEDARYEEIMECMRVDSPSSQELSRPSGHGKEDTFNLGVGFGIIYLMAASKCEFNKMVDLHKQMERLVQEFKMQFQNQQKHTVFGDLESNVTITTPEKAQDQTNNISLQENPYSMETQNSVASSSRDQRNCCRINIIPNDTKMDQLEAELEVELEHLQVQLDNEVMINCDYSETVVDGPAPEESITSLIYEPALDFEPSQMIVNMENDGVSPIELERRLHELVAMRQEARIKTLESALECAMQKLHENEEELSWWKDTARLVFQKIPRHYCPVS